MRKQIRTDWKSARRGCQYGGNRRGLGSCTDLAAQRLKDFFISVVDYWNGTEGQRNKASCASAYRYFFVTFSNEVGEISDLTTPTVLDNFTSLALSMVTAETYLYYIMHNNNLFNKTLMYSCLKFCPQKIPYFTATLILTLYLCRQVWAILLSMTSFL